MINKEMWERLDCTTTDKEKMTRPSLTYWADAFSRLKKNVLAMISAGFLILLILAVIFVPMFWKNKYSDQVLGFANIPPTLKIYDIGNNSYVYITTDFRLVEVSEGGKLLAAPTGQNDVINRQYIYDGVYADPSKNFGGYDVVVNYIGHMKAQLSYNNALKTKDPAQIEQTKAALDATPLFTISVTDTSTNATTQITQYKTVRNASYILGTDQLGRDYFIRIIYGGRISLTIGFVAALVSLIIGVTYGAVAGYMGGRADMIMMRFVDTISTIPLILYVIVLMVVLSPSLGTIILALALTYWVDMARIVRGSVLTLKGQEFVLAARTIGASPARILFRHILPNTMGPVMVSLTMMIPSAIFTEAFLSFIGLGINAPVPSWGSIANTALPNLQIYPYQFFYPAALISITLLAFNLFGDGLRDALDPRLRK